MSLLITLPFPPRELSPNVRVSRWEKFEYQSSYREQCRVAGLNARREHDIDQPLPAPVKARITFVLTSKRRRDYDNLISSLKHGIDGLVRAHLLSDDSVWALQTSYDVELGTRPEVRIEFS